MYCSGLILQLITIPYTFDYPVLSLQLIYPLSSHSDMKRSCYYTFPTNPLSPHQPNQQKYLQAELALAHQGAANVPLFTFNTETPIVIFLNPELPFRYLLSVS